MQIIHSLPAGANRLPKPDISVEERVVESKVRARRHQVIRTGLLLGLTAVMLFVFISWRTDRMREAAAVRSTDIPVQALQKTIDELGRLPATLTGAQRGPLQSYASDADRFYAMHADGPVIIGTTSAVSLILHHNGRCVIIYDKGKVHAEWMSHGEYNDAAQRQVDAMKAFEEQRQARPPQLP